MCACFVSGISSENCRAITRKIRKGNITMRKYLVSFYVNDDMDSIEFYSDYRRGSKANRADAMAEIRKRKGDYIANRAEIYAIVRDLTD